MIAISASSLSTILFGLGVSSFSTFKIHNAKVGFDTKLRCLTGAAVDVTLLVPLGAFMHLLLTCFFFISFTFLRFYVLCV